MNFSALGKSSNNSSLNLSRVSRSSSLGKHFQVIFIDQSECAAVLEFWIQEEDLSFPTTLYFKSEGKQTRAKMLSKTDLSEARLRSLNEVLEAEIKPLNLNGIRVNSYGK